MHPPPETSAISSRVDLELSDVVSIRVLDKTATTAIDSLDLELVVTPTGAFTSDNFIVEAATSNRTGYKLYMSTDFQKGDPATYTTDLVNQEDDTYTIPTLGTSGVSLADFSQARGSYVNRWGYSLDNLTYDPVPAHDTTEEIGSSSTASAADRTDVYIGVNANMDKISGLYKNTLVFSGVANPIQTDYTLHFLPGTEESVTDLPTDQSVSEVSASHTFTIPSTAPSRAGYNFVGYTDGTNTYQPSDSITVLGGEDYTGSATLTAEWELASYTVSITNSNTTSGASSLSVPYGDSRTVTVTPNSGYYLSNVSCPSGYTCSGYSTGTSATSQQTVTVTNDNTASGGTLSFTGNILMTMQNQVAINLCKNASTGTSYSLTDTRDNNTYTVAKLADGKCWMTENLKLTGPTSGSRRLYPADTDITATYWDLPAVNTYFDTSCSDTAKNMLAGSSDSYGAYYNWYAATAGTGTCSTSSGDAGSSICPRGWGLPTGGSSGEFESLYNKYSSSSAMRGSPVNFVLSGGRYGSSTFNQGSDGYYWSSTTYNSIYAYILRLGSSSVNPVRDNIKSYGLTVRCVAR